MAMHCFHLMHVMYNSNYLLSISDYTDPINGTTLLYTAVILML